MASFSKCYCCHDQCSIGKQNIIILMGGISLHPSQKMVEVCVFKQGCCSFIAIQDPIPGVQDRDQLCGWGY